MDTAAETIGSQGPAPTPARLITQKLSAAMERYQASVGGQRAELLLRPDQTQTLELLGRRHRSHAGIIALIGRARSIGGRLCSTLDAIPSLLANGEFDWPRNRCEQLLLEDAIDIALDLTAEYARATEALEESTRAATARAERQRLETARYLHKKKVQAARDARWSHISPVAAAAFRMAARFPSGVVHQVAHALIQAETQGRGGAELELPQELDDLLWRLTADKLTSEQRELVGLPKR